MLYHILKEIGLTLGISPNTTSHHDKIIGAVGGGLGILLTYLTCTTLLGDQSSILLVASMGASAVLMFAVPHGALSQPWPILGGHVVSAFIGVTCAQYISDAPTAAAIAVGIAIAAMAYLRCLHPPGGATALFAAVSGPVIHDAGYTFIMYPVALNACLLLLTAILYNSLFHWRTYPAHGITRAQRLRSHRKERQPAFLAQEDLIAAMQQLDSFIDISAEDLNQIFILAQEHKDQKGHHPCQLKSGRFYSNGEIGKAWEVRQVISIDHRHVDFVSVAGANVGTTSRCLRYQFEVWAHTAVTLDNGKWLKESVHPI